MAVTPNDYATAAEINEVLSNLDLSGQTPQGITYSALLAKLATRASRAIDKWTNRKPGAYNVTQDTTQYYNAPGNNIYLTGQYDNRKIGVVNQDYLRLWTEELAAAPTSIGVSQDGSLTNYVALATTDYIMGPFNAPDWLQPYEWVELDLLNGHYASWYGFKRGVRIVGPFGYSTAVPDDIKQATIILAARLFKRGQQAYQDKVSVLDNALALTYLNRMDADLVEMISVYRKLPI